MAEVRRTVALASSADDVWALVGDFHGLAGWLPGIAQSDPEGDGELRRLTLADGGQILERLERLDDGARTCVYSIVESPLPITGYVSTMVVREAGDKCEFDWSGSFEPTDPDGVGVEIINGVYDGGIGVLKERFGG
jgi:hypothetical protein